jgi:hypothetical protein
VRTIAPSAALLTRFRIAEMLVFVDESGDPGMKQKTGTSLRFVIAAVLFVANDDAQACDDHINLVRQECFGDSPREFKFNKCCKDHRVKFLSAVTKFEFLYLGFVLNKALLYGPGFQYKEPFYKYTSKLLFENAKPYLSRATVVIDGSGNREFRQQLAKYLKSRINTDADVIKKVKTASSHSNNLLQLADMVCGAIARSYRSDKADRLLYRTLIKERELHMQVWPKK